MIPSHVCKNCGNHFTGNYCNNCGEKAYQQKDKRLIHFFEEGLHFITHFEGTLLTTIRTITGRPGKLSDDYCNGIRKKYFKPQSFFLLLVIIYLLFPYFQGLNMKMQYHANNGLYGDFALNRIHEAMRATGFSENQLADAFHQKSEKVSKFLLYIIIPFTALFFWLFLFRRRKYFFDHLVYAAEVNSFYVFWGFLIFPLIIYLLKLVAGRLLFLNEDVLFLINFIIFFIYIFFAARRFYSLKIWQSFLISFLFVTFHIFIVHLIYKFLLFVIVINQIH